VDENLTEMRTRQPQWSQQSINSSDAHLELQSAVQSADTLRRSTRTTGEISAQLSLTYSYSILQTTSIYDRRPKSVETARKNPIAFHPQLLNCHSYQFASLVFQFHCSKQSFHTGVEKMLK